VTDYRAIARRLVRAYGHDCVRWGATEQDAAGLVDCAAHDPAVRVLVLDLGRAGAVDLLAGEMRRAQVAGRANVRRNRAPAALDPPEGMHDPDAVLRGYEDFNHHPPVRWVDIERRFPEFRAPAKLAVAGRMARVWYHSDKVMQPGDQQGRPNDYIHCVVPQRNPDDDSACVCGFSLGGHDEPRALARVYDSAARGPKRQVRWPDAGYLIGSKGAWDVLIDGSDEIEAVRPRGGAMVLGAPDNKTYVMIAERGRRVALVTGGSMYVGPEGIVD